MTLADRDATAHQVPTHEEWGPLQLFAHADSLSLEEAEMLARLVAGHHLSSEAAEIARTATSSSDAFFAALPGAGDRVIDPRKTWAAWPLAERRLEAEFAITSTGQPYSMNFRHGSELEGQGPHISTAGMTGAGKSKFILSVVLNLALRHSPDHLQFLLIDFKEGAELEPLRRLPCVHAVFTNNAKDTALLDRVVQFLQGEITRRLNIVKAAGVSNAVDYELKRRTPEGARLPALPALIIVVDEFNFMIDHAGDHAQIFNDIALQGRAADVHLFVNGQSMQLSKVQKLNDNTHTKHAMKSSEGDSYAQIGSRIAADISKNEAGTGYTREESGLVRWRSFYLDAPYIPPKKGPSEDSLGRPVAELPGPRLFTSDDDVLPPEIPPAAAVTAVDEPEGPVETRTMMEYVIDQLVDAGGDAGHHIWLPMLEEHGREPLSALVDDKISATAGARTRWQDAYPVTTSEGLLAPCGQIDLPFEHRRDTYVLPLHQSGGHLAVTGAAGMGRTTLVQDVLLALAMQHSPADVQFFGLGRAVIRLEELGLAHAAGSAVIGDEAGKDRVLSVVKEIIESRRVLFAEHKLSSMVEFRGERAAGRLPRTALGGRYGDVFLVVDPVDEFRLKYAMDTALSEIAVEGSTYGVHMILTNANMLPQDLENKVTHRIELRLANPDMSTIKSAGVLRRPARNVPDDFPGRGITRSGNQFLAADPSLMSGPGRFSDPGPDALRELIAEINATVQSKTPGDMPKMTQLPTEVELREVLTRAPQTPKHLVRFGVSERELEPAVWNYQRHPHLMVCGMSQHGKTEALKSVAAAIMSTHAAESEAIFVVFDPRQTMLGFIPETAPNNYAVGYTTRAAELKDFLQGLKEGLLDPRRPKEALSQSDRLSGARAYSGPEVFIIADDLQTAPPADPFAGYFMEAIVNDLDFADQLGMHLIGATTSRNWMPFTMTPVGKKLLNATAPVLVLNTTKDDLVTVYGEKGRLNMPRGRARWLTPDGRETVQIALAGLAPVPPLK
ncbi:type VII secretion protein EccCb [Tsukamurella sp. 8F]|uniref:type VII secretion protein EccCb n=1 Tax=unclassified Tsukamurella TaxID=2633480 RepID=UPI0023B9B44B|nr:MULTISPECIES: type VII secretion protein EccCb [unclassified Tsukamurella]MDF0531146.1 type VII secretion protein EccCb [Tsukamurella sp. 8J]MDF0588392.1 type VII secretion protein EccCb [Tsukamurella sp. 8F]